MPVIKLTLEYDGSRYNGWQVQRNGTGVQEIVLAAVRRMTKEKNNVIGASRTDAGVHASGQVAHFHTRRTIPPHGWVRGLNSILPEEIRVRTAADVAASFHARKDAKWKHYRYLILCDEVCSPLLARRVWHIFRKLDVKAMRKAAALLKGRHDFRAFAASNDGSKSKVREIYSVAIHFTGHVISIDIIGNGFLKQMVRNIVGTLVEVGEGRRNASNIGKILASRDRKMAGRCAPPYGLYLMEVGYRKRGEGQGSRVK